MKSSAAIGFLNCLFLIIICTTCQARKERSVCDRKECKCQHIDTKRIIVNCEGRQSKRNPLPIKAPNGLQVVDLIISGYTIPTLKKAYFRNLRYLQTINMIGNKIHVLEDGTLKGCKYLKSVNFGVNEISDINNSLPDTVRQLIMSSNRLRNLKSLHGLKLKRLNVEDNGITELRGKDLKDVLLSNASLNLAGNRLVNMKKGTFSDIILESLDLSRNNLSSLLEDGLFNAHVKKLNLINTSISVEELNSGFWTFQTKVVTELQLDYNEFIYICGETFINFPKLRVLRMSHAGVDTCSSSAFKGLFDLRELTIAHNPWLSRAPILHNRTLAFSPNLEVLDITFTGISLLREDYFKHLGKLKTFRALNTGLWRFLDNTFRGAHQLEIINVKRSRLRYIGEFAFAGTRLKYLDLSYNMYSFNRQNRMWALPHLEKLWISHNDFNERKVPAGFFMFTPMLKYLNMSDMANFLGFDDMAFSNLSSLEEVNLNQLNLGKINWKLFNSTNLKRLYLRHNQIRVIDFSRIPKRIRKKLELFDVSDNSLQCDCDLRQFRTWLCDKSSGKIFPGGNNYTCNIGGSSHYNICNDWRLHCSDLADREKIMIGLIVGVLGIFLLVPLLVWASYYQRYRIKWYYLKWKMKFMLKRNRYEEYLVVGPRSQLVWYEDDYSHPEDCIFVRDKLVPLMENDLNVKLLIKDRDAGKLQSGSFAEMIIECIERSQRVILVISTFFCQKKWAQFVVDVLVNKIVRKEHDKYPICIMREEVDPGQCTRSLSYLLARAPKIKWPKPDEDTEAALDVVRTDLRQYVDEDINIEAMSHISYGTMTYL